MSIANLDSQSSRPAGRRETVLISCCAVLLLVGSLLEWGTFTAPISTEGLFKGAIHTFHLTGWTGAFFDVPTWSSVLLALSACGFGLFKRSKLMLVSAAAALVYLVPSALFLVGAEKTTIGPGIVISCGAAAWLLAIAIRSLAGQTDHDSTVARP